MPNSLPALTAGILQSNQIRHVRSAAARFERTPLVPAYYVDDRLPPGAQPQRAAKAVGELVQKLDRLRQAYEKWPIFEASPFFDLYPAHAKDFYLAEETPYTLRVRLYCDLLLPTFRAAEHYWVEQLLPAYRASHNGTAHSPASPILRNTMSQMARLLDLAEQTITETLSLLSDDLSVLVSLGGLEERIQHRPLPGTRLAPALLPDLQRMPREMPTLTLDVTYSRPEPRLPAYESWQLFQGQPGR